MSATVVCGTSAQKGRSGGARERLRSNVSGDDDEILSSRR